MDSHYSITLIWSNEDAAYIASIPELPGCKADGKTPQEAFAELEIVAAEWIATAKELKRQIPQPLSTEDYQKKADAFRAQVREHVQREVDNAVTRVINDIARLNPMLAGAQDPADYWKHCEVND